MLQSVSQSYSYSYSSSIIFRKFTSNFRKQPRTRYLFDQLSPRYPERSQRRTDGAKVESTQPDCTNRSHLSRYNLSPHSRYMDLPYLINGCKFDLRIYVLITSIEPLRVYIYGQWRIEPFYLIRTSDEGLVRFCVNEYTTDPEKITDNMMHVCNYDVNKLSDKCTPNDDPLQPQGHKWT